MRLNLGLIFMGSIIAVVSDFLPVNGHAVANIFLLNSINSLVLYSSRI